VIHLVQEQRRGPTAPGGFGDRGAGRGREPQLGDGSQDLNLDPARGDARHRVGLGDAARVRRQLGAFDLAGALHHDAVVSQVYPIGKGLVHGDEVVELHGGVIGEDDLEASGCGRHGPVDQADHAAHGRRA